jgi:hypothetical protein
VRDDVQQDFLAAHAARVAICEPEAQVLCQCRVCQRAHVEDELRIDFPDCGSQCAESRGVFRIRGVVAVADPLQVRLEDAVHDVDVVEDSDRAVRLGRMLACFDLCQLDKQFLVRPRLVGEQRQQGGLVLRQIGWWTSEAGLREAATVHRALREAR